MISNAGLDLDHLYYNSNTKKNCWNLDQHPKTDRQVPNSEQLQACFQRHHRAGGLDCHTSDHQGTSCWFEIPPKINHDVLRAFLAEVAAIMNSE